MNTTRSFPWAGRVAIAVGTLICLPLWAADGAPPAAPARIESVVVNGRQLPVETLIDRKIYRIADDLQSVTGSATDVLGAIPSVEVDGEGVVALRGDTSVLILLDGRPLAQLSGPLAGQSLQQIPAQDIERIEVLTTPPPEFKAEGAAGAINIVLRRNRRAGLSGTLNASVGNVGRFLLGAGTSWRSDALAVNGGLSLRQDDREREVVSDLAAPGAAAGAAATSHSDLNEHARRRFPQLKTGVDYAFDSARSLNLSVTRGGRTGSRSFLQRSDSTTPEGAILGDTERNSLGSEWSMDSDARLVYRQRLAEPDQQLTLTAHHSQFHEREHYDYRNLDLLAGTAASFDDLDLREDQGNRELAVDYQQPLGEGDRIKLGWNFEQQDNQYGNRGDTIDPVTALRTVNPLLSNDFALLQRTTAFYASLQSHHELWSSLAGLRLEQARSLGRGSTGAVVLARDDTRLYPSLRLDHPLSDQATLSFGLSRRVTHPDASALNPYADHQDVRNLRAGNPDLLPQDTQAYELDYAVEQEGRSWSVSAYLRHNRNTVTDLTQLMADGVTLTTKANLPTNDASGVEISANGRFAPRLSYSLSANLFQSEVDAGGLGQPGLRSTRGVNAKVRLDWRPDSQDMAQIALTRSDRRLTAQGEVAAINLLNLGYRRQFSPVLSAVATVSDLFNGQRLRRQVLTATLDQVYQRQIDGRIAYLGLVYALGAQPPAKPAGFEYDQ